MSRRALIAGSVVAGWLALVPALARADGFFTPFYGRIGDAPRTDVRRSDPKGFGFSLGGMSSGVFGFETDVSFSPDFFGDSDSIFIGSNSMTTIMGNAILGLPFGGQRGFGVRPYVVGGFGAIRQRVESVTGLVGISNTSWGYDVGGGAFLYFADHIGVRGDARYFKTTFEVSDVLDLIGVNPDDNEAEIDYWRYTIGLSLRW